MLPKISNPLAKSIRTGEGILVYITNIVLAVAAGLPHGLSWTKAGLYLAILNAVHVVARTTLKVSAIAAPALGGDPVYVNPVDPASVTEVVADVGQAVVDVSKGAKK